MWKMLKDDFEFFRWFYKEAPLSTFVTHLISHIFAYIPLLLFYGLIALIAFYFSKRTWGQFAESINIKAILQSPLRLFLFAVCACVVIAFRRVWLPAAGALWHGLCIFALAVAFLYFLFVNPIGLLLFFFIFF